MVLFQFGPVALVEFSYRFDQVFDIKHTIAAAVQTSSGTKSQSSGFGSIGIGTTDKIVPVSPDFGIVIEKINANAKVIPNVNPANETEYRKALQQGVAEAIGSTPPGEPGNLFLFSHSTDAPWDVARYNAIFYLLRELNVGDRVIIFYQGRRYDYYVYDKVIVPPTDISYLTNRYNAPVLTLQTCDPPGTSINRLIVRAKLAGT